MATKPSRTDFKGVDRGLRMCWEVLEKCAAVQSRSVASGGPPQASSEVTRESFLPIKNTASFGATTDDTAEDERALAAYAGLEKSGPVTANMDNLRGMDSKVLREKAEEKKRDAKKSVIWKGIRTRSVPAVAARVCDEIARRSSITLARDIRDMFGNFEAEVTCGDESDLHHHYDDCDKNPEHLHFKRAREFSLRDLPRKYQQKSLYNSIQILASLTVRVAVTTVSDGRRAVYAKLGKPVKSPPFVTYGTGRVFKVSVFEGKERRECPCQECIQPGATRMSWGYVEILTARHIVFDGDEALATVCRWGYDGDDCPEINFVGIGAKVSLKETDDWCKLRCVTHDVKLLAKLQSDINKYEKISSEIYKTCRGNPKKKSKFIAIVSHPHGCPKQITTGYWRSCVRSGELDVKYTYTAATCSGSSGAPVYILGRDGRAGLFHHIHSGNRIDPRDADKNYNNHSVCVFD